MTPEPDKLHSFEVLAHIPMHEPVGRFPMIESGSLFAAAMDSKARLTHVSCGPWLESRLEGSSDSAYRAVVAVVYGCSLKFIIVDTSIMASDDSKPASVRMVLSKPSGSLLHGWNLEAGKFTGPLLWIHTVWLTIYSSHLLY
jgi:hypothetical protein